MEGCAESTRCAEWKMEVERKMQTINRHINNQYESNALRSRKQWMVITSEKNQHKTRRTERESLYMEYKQAFRWPTEL